MYLCQVQNHTQEAINGGIEHDATHHCRHRRWRGRVRFGQPHMQWKQTGLGAEAEHCKQERDRRPERRQRLGAHVREGVVAGIGLQDAKAQQDRDRPDVCHGDVQVAGAANLRDAVVGGHQEER